MKKIVLVIAAVLFVFSMAYSGDFTYIGSKKCKMCHKGEKKGMVYEKWEKGPHAKAFETLKKEGGETKAECIVCHTTGYDKGGYQMGAANADDFAHVGCESCHGPGSAYKKMSIMKDKAKAMENGLIIPSEKVCIKCHNEKSKDFKGFNYDEYVKKIDHTYQK